MKLELLCGLVGYEMDQICPTGWRKNGTVFLYALTLSNISRFSKLFHCQNQEKIY